MAGAFLLLAGLGLGLAQTTVVLNSTYVPWDDPVVGPGWVRVWSAGKWSNIQDDPIAGRSLVRFDISSIPQGATISSATLKYYRQKSIAIEPPDPPEYMDVFHVTADNWNPNQTYPLDLYNWATSGAPVSTVTGTEGWNAINIASWLQDEVNLGDPWLSIKFEQRPFTTPAERIASPTTWYSNHRPYIEVVYTDPTPSKPDLTVNRHDIAFNPMWPVPYTPVTITATVHNVGGLPTDRAFPVRFLDNGVPIGSDVWITNPIPGGGGWATAQITWYPTEGEHPIEVIADPGDPGEIPEINNFNNSNLQNHDEYKFEVRGQYKYYVESFETGGGPYGFGTYQRDMDQCIYAGQPQDIQVTRTNSGPAYDGTWHVEMFIDGRPDDGSAWLERHIPVTPDVTFIEVSAFGILVAGFPYGLDPLASLLPRDPDVWAKGMNQWDFTHQGLYSGTYRRRRHCQAVSSLAHPEFFAAAGMGVDYEEPFTGLFDLYTVRVNPPRSSADLATAYNNGAKLVWDGLSTHHLIYVSGDSILYSRSEDPAGDTWSDAEFVGFVVPGQYPAIALAPDGYPRAVWSNGLNLYYSKRSDTGWQSPPQEWLFL